VTSPVQSVFGVACVVAAVALFVVEVPETVRALDASLKGVSYIKDPVNRSLTSGDMLGIPRDLQTGALSKIPAGSKYALLLPGDEQSASTDYGIAPVTYETVAPWLNYLLLPSRQVPPEQARYIICWGCDTSPWDHHTTWLFGNSRGVAIGRVRDR
jgi:hypothetical protein